MFPSADVSNVSSVPSIPPPPALVREPENPALSTGFPAPFSAEASLPLFRPDCGADHAYCDLMGILRQLPPLRRTFADCGHIGHNPYRPCNMACEATGPAFPYEQVASSASLRCSDCRKYCPPLAGQSHCCSPGCSCPPDCVCTLRSVNPGGCVSHAPLAFRPPLSFGG
jgi:hypothetical protein